MTAYGIRVTRNEELKLQSVPCFRSASTMSFLVALSLSLHEGGYPTYPTRIRHRHEDLMKGVSLTPFQNPAMS